MAKKRKKGDALTELLGIATHKVLSELILELTTEFPEVRRECFDFLKSQVSISKSLEKRSEGEAIMALWSELAPDLGDLDSYGGGDYATEDLVAELLDQIRERLETKNVDNDHRKEILNLALPYIQSGNAGMDDMLYEVAYAACYDDDDLRELAQAFKKICTSAEWKSFEPKVISKLKNTWGTDRLKIRMHRREYDEALAILTKGRYPTSTWEGDYEIKVAQKLEKRYPEEILKYYLSGLGNLNRSTQRKEYTRKARVMGKVRHVLVDVLSDEPRWVKFARKVKKDNVRRPAFQQEFANAVPGWWELT